MPLELPFQVPARLPNRIDPCPIVEAVMEVRFVPTRPWAHFPGLFAERFGSEYKKEEDIGIAQIPEVFRENDPSLVYAPYRRMIGDAFILQFGPRVVNLVTRRGAYPGWGRFWPAMESVLRGIRELGLVKETSRVGLRYINFFKGNVFDNLSLTLAVSGVALNVPETGINTVFHDGRFRNFLQINNATVVAAPDGKPEFGSILDIDTTFEPRAVDIFSGAQELFASAHVSEKRVFFGLLKPEFVSTLSPTYDEVSRA